MAYPGEHEDFAYKQYAIEVQTQGQKPLSKEEWLKRRAEDEAKKRRGERTNDETFEYPNSDLN